MAEGLQLTKQERRLLRKEEKESARKRTETTRLVKRLSLWALILIAAGGAVVGFSRLGGSSGANQTALLLDAVSPGDWTKGAPGAKVTLVEYSDFQCPACASYYPVLRRLTEEYGDRIAFVYRHFPLPQHGNANLAARAAEAAGKQGKFWEMHNVLFERQMQWAESGDAQKMFEGYASSLGLDLARFSADLESEELKTKVRTDAASGLRAGVNSTPTFFVNGAKMQQPHNLDEFKQYLDTILAGA